MANKRVQVDGQLMQPEPLQTNIKPIDTYFQPGMAAVEQPGNVGANLQGLAHALSGLAPVMMKYADQKNEEDKKRSAAQAAILAQKNQDDWNTFLAKPGNEQYRKSNPWLKVYYEQAVLKQLAQDVDRQARIDWSVSPEKENDDPNAFNQFWKAHEDAALSKIADRFAPRNVAEAYIPEIYKSKNALENEHINYRQKARLDNANAAYDKTVLKNTKDFKIGYSAQAKTKAEELDKNKNLTPEARAFEVKKFRADYIRQYTPKYEEEIQKAVQLGLNKQDIYKRTAEAIIATAVDQGDSQVLDLLDNIKTGDGILGDIDTDIKNKRSDAEKRIFSDYIQKEDYAYKVSERANGELSKKHQSDAFAALYGKHDADISKSIEILNSIGKTDEAISLMKLQMWLQEKDAQPVVNNDAAVRLINRSYSTDFNPSEAISAVGTVGLSNAKQAIDNFNWQKTQGGRYQGFLRDSIESADASMKEALKPRWSTQKGKANEAILMAKKDFENWRKGQPNVDEFAASEKYFELSEKWIKRYLNAGSGVSLKSQQKPAQRTPGSNPKPLQPAGGISKDQKKTALKAKIMADARLSVQRKRELIKQLESK